MRSAPVAIASVMLLASVASAQVVIRGSVVESDASGGSVPVSEAYVLAISGPGEEIVGEAVTDSRGRYSLGNLPPGRYTLQVDAQGFYTTHAGGHEAAVAVKTCVDASDCGEADFRVARSAVVEGWVTDAYGEPFPGASASLFPESSADATDLAERHRASAGRAIADDRGYFRIWGLRPGRYELEAPPGQTRLIEIEPGQASVEARITISPTQTKTYQVSGIVEGVSEEDLRGAYLRISSLNRYGWSGPGFMRPDRTFSLTLEQGEYAIQLEQRSGRESELRFLTRISVDRDIEGLRLEPRPPTRLRGRLAFEDSPEIDLGLSLLRRGDAPGREIPVDATGGSFDKAGLLPDEYALSVTSPDYYVIAPTAVTIGPGRMEPVVVRVSNQRGSVRGVVRSGVEGERRPAPFAALVLAGERGQNRAQADAEGRFVFEDLIPGEYEISASPNLDAAPLSPDARRVTVEPGFDVEIDLTVSQ